MGQNGRRMGPVDTGARFNVAFQVVGVQLDQTGGEEGLPSQSTAPCGTSLPWLMIGDHPIRRVRLPRTGLLGQNKRGIGKD